MVPGAWVGIRPVSTGLWWFIAHEWYSPTPQDACGLGVTVGSAVFDVTFIVLGLSMMALHIWGSRRMVPEAWVEKRPVSSGLWWFIGHEWYSSTPQDACGLGVTVGSAVFDVAFIVLGLATMARPT